MKMKCQCTVLAMVLSLLCAGFVWGQGSSSTGFDDILPVVSGGESKVQKPSVVKVDTKKEIVEAATMQDATNAAVDHNINQIKTKRMEMGCMEIKVGSGIGFVATGLGTYRPAPNPTAARLSKRHAYVAAFLMAKKCLAEKLNGLNTDGQNRILVALHNANTLEKELSNMETQGEELIKQSAAMLLKGFVIYEVEDRTDENSVYVSIVTTPKTRGELARPTSNSIAADSLREGLKQVVDEIRTGIVPPVGGKVVIVPATGEMALVGFGSAVVSSSENPANQAKLKLSAQKIADMRAADSLCGLMIGDETAWEGQFNDKYSDVSKQFPEVAQGDPIDNGSGQSQLNGIREEFVNTMKTTDLYSSARKGVLPPGLNRKIWFDDEGAWAYAMCIYMPSATTSATKAAQSMGKAQLLQNNSNASSGKTSSDHSGSETRTKANAVIKQGPTGQVSNDDDL